MALVGMDIPAAENVAGLIQTTAQEIEKVTKACTAQVQGLEWLGDDANRYKQEVWGTEAEKAFHHVQTTLMACRELLLKNIEEQRQATEQGSTG